MNRFKRPKQEKDWRAATRDARKALKKVVQKNPGQVLPENVIPPLWNDDKVTFTRTGVTAKLRVKDLFCIAQFGLCGYCGANLSATGTGNLDHYRPTRSITREILSPGQEIAEDNSRVKDRRLRPHPPHRPGWWDLAYDWKNYVFACGRCNGPWKDDLFRAKLNGQPYFGGRDPQEEPLLLNPFEKIDTSLHLEFDDAGLVKGKTDRGTATIQTCGLDRPSLVTDRKPFVELAELHCKNIQGCTDKTKLRDCYKKLVARGSWNSQHALVVRQTAERKLGVSWSEIEKRAK